MGKSLVIAQRELRSFFDSPVAYIVLVTFLLASGWMFFGTFFLMGRADMRGFFAPSPFSPSMLLVIIAPALTMRLLADEKKTGTIEWLTTMPITDTEIVVGKYLGALALLTIGLLATVSYPLTIAAIGDLDWGVVIAGYSGLFLFGASLLAIGVLCSALTSNQIIAFLQAFMVGAALYFVFWLQFFMPQGIARVVEYLSLSFHLDNLARGVIDSRDVLYFLSLVVASLFFAVRSLNRQHA